MKPNRKISNPRGVGDSKRIALSLLPNEMAKIERLAAKSGASKSRVARSLVLKGLQTNNSSPLLRHHVEAWRKREGMSRQSVAMVIVDAHERIGGPADTGIDFDPPSKDAYSRVATNSERIWRWLDDVTKETNYLPANFAKSILAAMPLDIRMAALDEYLRGVGMACRQLPGSAECTEFTPGALGGLLKETSEAAVAFTALLDGHNKAELQAAQKELSQAVTMMSYQLAKVESALN